MEIQEAKIVLDKIRSTWPVSLVCYPMGKLLAIEASGPSPLVYGESISRPDELYAKVPLTGKLQLIHASVLFHIK